MVPKFSAVLVNSNLEYWSTGVLEYGIADEMKDGQFNFLPITALLQYSNAPAS
jgi:hypothetical protein